MRRNDSLVSTIYYVEYGRKLQNKFVGYEHQSMLEKNSKLKN